MIIFDLEWNDGYKRPAFLEILQIGAVKVDHLGGPILDSFNAFIRPTYNRKINRYAKKLPDWEESMDANWDFPPAFARFADWCGDETEFGVWGGSEDFETLQQNCQRWRLPCLCPAHVYDLQACFCAVLGTNQQISLNDAMDYCGYPTPFDFHNALYDAMYTAILSGFIREDSLELCSLPPRVRRMSRADFTPPEPMAVGPFTAPKNALDDRGVRRNHCPICGASGWVRVWHYHTTGSYYATVSCETHGEFLSRLTLSQVSGSWQGERSIPAVDIPLLKDYQAALRGKEHFCRGTAKKKRPHRHRHNSKKAENTSEHQEA